MPPDDRPIPAAPCPTCLRPLAARSGEVGRVVRCDGCGTRFRVALAVEVAPLPDPDEPEPPRRRAKVDAGNLYDDGYGRFDETVTPGRVVALATMHFVYVGLLSVCGVLSSVLLRVYPVILPGPDVAPGHRVFAHALHVLMVVGSVVLLVAGLTVVRRRPSGRVWSMVGVGVAALLLALSLADIAFNIPPLVGQPGGMGGVMWGILYQVFFWLGYIIPVSMLLAAADPEAGPTRRESAS